MGSIPTVSISFFSAYLSGVSHSGQLQGTVNPSTSVYAGSNPAAPIILSNHFDKITSRAVLTCTVPAADFIKLLRNNDGGSPQLSFEPYQKILNQAVLEVLS